MAKIIDGNKVALIAKDDLRQRIIDLDEIGVTASLAVILVGDNPASKIYINKKTQCCKELGIVSELHSLPSDTTQEELLNLVYALGKRYDVDGILVQLPLPKHINDELIIEAINPNKDVDAFHAHNTGKIMIGNYKFLPCTPAGIMHLINSTGVNIAGKHCVVIGRSNIVGKPMAMLLLQAHGTVTICHSKTENLAEICRSADILVVAIGKAKLITADMVKPGAIVIDVGMNRDEKGKLCGDVDFESVEQIAGYITPVPGGVGPMTIAMLMQNTVIAAENFSAK